MAAPGAVAADIARDTGVAADIARDTGAAHAAPATLDTAATLATDTADCPDEVPYNGRDEDCDGADLTDVDGDGWDAAVVGGADCNDGDAAVHPDAREACANLVDDDCDGETDEGCALADAGPPDPGGFYWICGPPVAPGGGTAALLTLLFALVTLRRRLP